MLSPQARTVAMDLLRPPPGLHLDLAVLTTYTLDLEALLALPLAVMAHADGGVEKLLEDPLLLLQALRETAVTPFVKGGALDAIRDLGRGERRLISRQEELQALSEAALTPWSEVRVLTDAVSDETEDESSRRPSGLHAKIVGVEHGWDVTWFVGSANLTNSALNGRNVEVMAEITGRKSRVGISQFLDGFDGLCETYRASDEKPATEGDDHEAEQVLERAVLAVVEADLQIACRPMEELWEWRLDGEVPFPDSVAVRVWPVSVNEDRAAPLNPPVSLALPMSRLTAFVAFHLTVDSASVEDRRLALKLPMHGVPAERTAQVLRSLIDSPERLLAFLRALLGGLEGLPDMMDGDAVESGGAPWRLGLEAETLLEDMLRAASRDPERLETVRRLFADLRSTPEGRRIVPDELHAVWQAVDATLGTAGTER